MKILEPNYVWSAKLQTRGATDTVVLHHAAANGVDALTIHAWHKARGWSGIGYHYYVRKDGTIERGRPEWAIGGHTSGENYHTLGVCFEGNFETDTMPEAQIASGAELLADIFSRYREIATKKHGNYTATACPGKNFPFDTLHARARAIKVGAPDKAPITPSESAAVGEDKKSIPSDWARSATAKAISSGLFQGDGKGDYNWHDSVTREAFAVLMDRLGLLD